jgi:hypothetical protein
MIPFKSLFLNLFFQRVSTLHRAMNVWRLFLDFLGLLAQLSLL